MLTEAEVRPCRAAKQDDTGKKEAELPKQLAILLPTVANTSICQSSSGLTVLTFWVQPN